MWVLLVDEVAHVATLAPAGDVIAHDLGVGCVCGPSVEVVPDPAGGPVDGAVITHHPLVA